MNFPRSDGTNQRLIQYWSSLSMESRHSPGGNEYLLLSAKDGDFTVPAMRTLSSIPSEDVRRRPITKWDDRRYLSLESHYIVDVGSNWLSCSVGIRLSEPASVERRPPDEER
jgi:hypothetical protein